MAQLDAEDRWPMIPAVRSLQILGVVKHESPLVRGFLRLMHASLARRADNNTGMVIALGQESIRQAGGRGSPQVTSAHLVLAILALARQLSLARREILASSRRANQAAAILGSHGLEYDAALPVIAASMAAVGGGPSADSRHFPFPRRRPEDPPWTVELADALDLAYQMATQWGHRTIGDTHLLAAALSSEASVACRALTDLGIDPAAVRRDARDALPDTA